MSMSLLVLAVLTFAHAADVCTDGECHDADGGLSMLQGSRERTTAISSDKMLSGDSQKPKKTDYEGGRRVCVDPSSQWSVHPNTYCVGNWKSDWGKHTIKTLGSCKSECQASDACLGVVVGEFENRTNRCVLCTSLTLRSRDPSWPSTHLKAHPSWCQITCPVIGALFKAGDLVPDETGHVKKAQVVEAMLRVGLEAHLVEETTNGNFDHLNGDKEINLFNMDLAQSSTKTEALRNVEHDFSTGIRDGAKNNEDEYREFEDFIDEDGDAENWVILDIEAAITYYKKQGNANDLGTGDGGIGSLRNMFNSFKDDNGALSKYEMKQLFLNSDYPVEFTQRRDEAVSAAAVNGTIFTYAN